MTETESRPRNPRAGGELPLHRPRRILEGDGGRAVRRQSGAVRDPARRISRRCARTTTAIKDTGDGALIAFLSNPEHALYMALAIAQDFARAARRRGLPVEQPAHGPPHRRGEGGDRPRGAAQFRRRRHQRREADHGLRRSRTDHGIARVLRSGVLARFRRTRRCSSISARPTTSTAARTSSTRSSPSAAVLEKLRLDLRRRARAGRSPSATRHDPSRRPGRTRAFRADKARRGRSGARRWLRLSSERRRRRRCARVAIYLGCVAVRSGHVDRRVPSATECAAPTSPTAPELPIARLPQTRADAGRLHRVRSAASAEVRRRRRRSAPRAWHVGRSQPRAPAVASPHASRADRRLERPAPTRRRRPSRGIVTARRAVRHRPASAARAAGASSRRPHLANRCRRTKRGSSRAHVDDIQDCPFRCAAQRFCLLALLVLAGCAAPPPAPLPERPAAPSSESAVRRRRRLRGRRSADAGAAAARVQSAAEVGDRQGADAEEGRAAAASRRHRRRSGDRRHHRASRRSRRNPSTPDCCSALPTSSRSSTWCP